MLRNILLFFSLLILPASASQPALIPLPRSVTFETGTLVASGQLKITCPPSCETTASLLENSISQQWKTAEKGLTKIDFTVDKSLTEKLGEEGYTLQVKPNGILIKGATPAGVFYASQTLLQLAQTTPQATTIPCVSIEDSPRFEWRGLMLDEARHFMGKEYVLRLLDRMAAHKLNLFHWHLTDNEGWRIEIKAYPKLTSIGSHRGEGTSLPTPKWDKKKESDPDGAQYSGHYTQQDIREIVAYAKARHIDVMPEIDVPGHARAIAVAYPEVLPKSDRDAGTGVHGIKGNVLSVVRPENYQMLDTIFEEVAALFPFKYIHVGGDEVNVNAWKASPEHRALMAERGMKNPHQLQNMFMLRLEKILKKHNRTMMGWNEIMHGGQLSKDTGVMAWISIGAGLNAARAGHPTIMGVGPHCYFDMKYPGHSETGHWWAGIVSTRSAYEWNPVFEGQLKAEEQARVQGVQCALWTEYVPNTADADYKFWPRAVATAEVAWSPQSQRTWDDFNQRLGQHLDYLDTLGIGYRVQPPSAIQAKGKITLVAPHPGAKIVYTLDGSDPTAASTVYNGQFISVSEITQLRYRHLRPNGRLSKVERGAERPPVFSWNYKQSGPFSVELSDTIDRAGPWIAHFHYKRGKHAHHFKKISLLADGQVIASAEAFTLSGKQRSQQVRLKLPHYKKGVRYTLVIDAKADGDKSSGQITFDRSPFIEPDGGSCDTQVPAYGNHTPQQLVDWNRSSFFWSSRNGKKGDSFTIRYPKGVSCKKVIIPTGKPNSNDDIVQHGILEYSTDGRHFTKGTHFALGTATLELDTRQSIKALRIRLTADQSSWYIVRDPEIE